MRGRIIDEEIQLIKYYPNYKTALEWYQDLEVCKQVDNRDTIYDLPLLKRMYNYLNQHGDLFYIKYKNRLCGDVCLQPDGEVNIVVAKTVPKQAYRQKSHERNHPTGKGKRHAGIACRNLYV